MANATEVTALLDKIAGKLTDLVTLTVTTVVTPLEIVQVAAQVAGGVAGWAVAPPPAGAAQAWSTEINLLDGKIRNTLTQAFVNGDLTSLADFHKSQVQQAKDIVHGNIAALIALAKTIRDL